MNPYEASTLPVAPHSLAVRAKKLVWPIIAGVMLAWAVSAEYRSYVLYSQSNNAWTDAVHEYRNTNPEFREFLSQRLR